MAARGFAALSPERLREISSKGGKGAQAKGTAHKWTSETARAAGAKGGTVTQARRRVGPKFEGNGF